MSTRSLTVPDDVRYGETVVATDARTNSIEEKATHVPPR